MSPVTSNFSFSYKANELKFWTQTYHINAKKVIKGIFEILEAELCRFFFLSPVRQSWRENVICLMTAALDFARGWFCIFQCTKNAHLLILSTLIV